MDTISGSGLTLFKSNHCHGNNNINPARAPLCRRYRLNRIKGQKCQIAFHVCVCVCVCVRECVCVRACVSVCVCVCVWGHVYVVYEDTNLYNDMGMT